MNRYAAAALCFLSVCVLKVNAQKSTLAPIAVPAGTVLTFHLQTRLNPGTGNELDVLPKGTALRVRLWNGINSGVDRDGAEFRGQIVSSIVSGKEVVIHSDSEVRGLFALLRSRSHPEGFRYELLVTKITDQGKTYDVTASLNASLDDATAHPPATKAEPVKTMETPISASEKAPGANAN